MRLHSHQSGDGPPLLLLHGLFGSLTNWLGISRALAAHFTVFVVDQRNHGRSPHADEMSYPQMAEDLAEFLEDRGLVSAHILGHSMGGKVAMQCALSHPARVQRVVVADMAPRETLGRHEDVLAALESLDPSRFRSREALDAVLAERLPDAVLRRFLLKNLIPGKDGLLRWQVHLSGIRAGYPHLMTAVMGGRPFTKPVLILRGEKSDYVTDSDLIEIRRLFPKATLQTLPGAGHWLHAEAPVEFVRRVLDFLTAAPRNS